VRKRWLSRRAFVLHFLLITVVPACLLAGWWQVHRALSGNLLSYFYSVEWPIFAILGVVAWWQLIHDVRLETEYEDPRRERRSFLHRDEEVPSRPLVWDQALESPELRTYNQYLRVLADRGGPKTWGNPRGLPADALAAADSVDGLGVQEAAAAGRWGGAHRRAHDQEVTARAEPRASTDGTDTVP
jgi:DNA-binding transcriptional regulator of glucitol operon